MQRAVEAREVLFVCLDQIKFNQKPSHCVTITVSSSSLSQARSLIIIINLHKLGAISCVLSVVQLAYYAMSSQLM